MGVDESPGSGSLNMIETMLLVEGAWFGGLLREEHEGFQAAFLVEFMLNKGGTWLAFHHAE